MIFTKVRNSETSYIGKKSHFVGSFYSKDGSLNIEGKYEGEFLEIDHLSISSTGKVKSDIISSNVDVEGLVIGNIHAKNRIFLRPKSRVLGDIHTQELIIQNGVILEGKCIIGENLENKKEKFNELFSKDINTT